MDAQISQQDDLGHDTLMGFQELDSHLAIFESTENRRGSSTPGTISTPGFDATIDTIESQPAFENFEHTIVVDTSTDHFQSDIKSRARVIKDPKPSTNGDKKYVLMNHLLLSFEILKRAVNINWPLLVELHAN